MLKTLSRSKGTTIKSSTINHRACFKWHILFGEAHITLSSMSSCELLSWATSLQHTMTDAWSLAYTFVGPYKNDLICLFCKANRCDGWSKPWARYLYIHLIPCLQVFYYHPSSKHKVMYCAEYTRDNAQSDKIGDIFRFWQLALLSHCLRRRWKWRLRRLASITSLMKETLL